jgi:hypothetical protein
VQPRPESRLLAPRRKRAKELHPHLLRHVGGLVGVVDEPAHDGVDVRAVALPEETHGAFVAGRRTADEAGVGVGFGRMHRRPRV